MTERTYKNDMTMMLVVHDALRVHHNAEDDALWPPILQAIGERADDLVVIDAMEAEHATVDPGLKAMDAALADRESGPERLGGVFDRLVGGLGGHLTHEENDALPLIDAYATPEVMQRFGLAHSSRIGAGVSRYLPSLLDSASAERTSAALPDPTAWLTSTSGNRPTPPSICGRRANGRRRPGAPPRDKRLGGVCV